MDKRILTLTRLYERARLAHTALIDLDIVLSWFDETDDVPRLDTRELLQFCDKLLEFKRKIDNYINKRS